MLVKGIEVTVNNVPDMSQNEIVNYINHIEKLSANKLQYLNIATNNDGNVELDYKLRPAKFERIRRITGYLVGTTERFNNAKKAEVHDRVKHGLN